MPLTVTMVIVLVTLSDVTADTPTYPKCITPEPNHCACMTDQGMISLAPLDSKDPSNPKFKTASSGYTYYYNPCTPFNIGNGWQKCVNEAVCQDSGNYAYGLGDHVSAVFTTDATTGMLTIHYGSGYYSSIVVLDCDEEQEGTLIITSTNSPFTFKLTSKYACPDSGGGGGLSPGSIMCIIFACLIFLYLVGGVLYMHCVKHAEGVEKIPHVHFWKEVPFLIKDGTLYVFRGAKHTTTGAAYTEM